MHTIHPLTYLPYPSITCPPLLARPKVVVYDGATGQSVGEVPDAHAGSIYSVAFSPDGTRFATASADKTIKVGR